MIEVSYLKSDPRGNWRWGFSTRRWGYSEGPYHSLNLALHVDDDTQAVIKNRTAFLHEVGGQAQSDWCSLEQVHGATVVEVKGKFDNRFGIDKVGPQGDILICTVSEKLLAVLVADCVPLLLADPIHKVYGVAHAGWRGVLQSVPQVALRAMLNNGAQLDTLQVAIGPAIGPDAFTINDDVYQQFFLKFGETCPQVFQSKGEKHTLNLWELCQQQLLDLELPDKQIVNVRHCTVTHNERFYSYRAQNQVAGRQSGFIWTGTV